MKVAIKTKLELRKIWRTKLSGLSTESIDYSSREISKNLLKLFDELNVDPQTFIIGVFAPFQQEPHWPLEWKKELHNKTAYPTMDKMDKAEKGKMVFRLARLSDLENKKDFGVSILGPTDACLLVDPKVVLIPGLAFAPRGYRLGRGKGFYDRTFENRSDVIKVGVAFESQITEELPIEPHDVKMDFIVTELRIINCNSFTDLM